MDAPLRRNEGAERISHFVVLLRRLRRMVEEAHFGDMADFCDLRLQFADKSVESFVRELS
jgi:hypothetical protein